MVASIGLRQGLEFKGLGFSCLGLRQNLVSMGKVLSSPGVSSFVKGV